MKNGLYEVVCIVLMGGCSTALQSPLHTKVMKEESLTRRPASALASSLSRLTGQYTLDMAHSSPSCAKALQEDAPYGADLELEYYPNLQEVSYKFTYEQYRRHGSGSFIGNLNETTSINSPIDHNWEWRKDDTTVTWDGTTLSRIWRGTNGWLIFRKSFVL